MPRTRIKICGIRDVATARLAVEAGADAVGLVFVAASPRCVTVAQARQIADALPAFVEPVGLFVDRPPEEVRRTAQAAGLRTVQLHGHEGPAVVQALAPLRVIRSVTCAGGETAAQLGLWRPPPANLAALLFDAPPPSAAAAAAGMTGGSGRTFDWQALAALAAAGALAGLPPLVIAGGLTPANVGQAIELLRPYAVDVSSGVESARGVKDAGLIRAFCAAVRSADG